MRVRMGGMDQDQEPISKLLSDLILIERMIEVASFRAADAAAAVDDAVVKKAAIELAQFKNTLACLRAELAIRAGDSGPANNPASAH